MRRCKKADMEARMGMARTVVMETAETAMEVPTVRDTEAQTAPAVLPMEAQAVQAVRYTVRLAA